MAAGDVVRTGDDPSTVAEVVHRNGAVTRLDRSSEIAVDRVEADGRARIVVNLGPGRTWHHTGPVDDPTLYEVRAPGVVVTARSARFALVCSPLGTTDVTAVDGHVVVRGVAGGSVVLSNGQTAGVDAAGVLADVVPSDAGDPWVALNLSLDAGPVVAETTKAAAAERASRWKGRVAMGLAAAAFVGIVGFTFVTADQASTDSRRSTAIPAGAAAAMIRAAQDRHVAPEEEEAPTTTAPAAPAAAVEAPVAPARPVGQAAGTSCRQSGRTIVYSGTVANVSSASSGFVVEAFFVDRSGARFDSAAATVLDVAPGASSRWEVRVPAPGDLRNSGASCELGAVRALASPSAVR